MGFAVKYDQMNAMWYSIQSACAAWNDELTEISSHVKSLSETSAIYGQGADNIKNYVSYVHGFAMEALSQVISAQRANSTLYKDGYLDGIDGSLHAVILEDELQDIRSNLKTQQKDVDTVDASVRSILSGVADLYSSSYEGAQKSDALYQKNEEFALKLGTDIISYENRCLASDFSETEQLIERLEAFLRENISQKRTYKESFNIQAWIQSEKTAALYEASVAQSKSIASKTEEIQAAFEREAARQEQLQLEYEEMLKQEERQKQATAINWAVAGICAIGSVAAIVATGGAATPLVVAGISAVSGAVIAGTNAMTSQYVATGSVTDWGAVAGSVVMGGVTGFVTGYIGAGLGNAITSSMQNTVLGQTLTNSSSRLIRMGTYGAINSISEMGSGVASRGAATLISGGSLEEAWDSAINFQNILVDGATGFAFGSIQGVAEPNHIMGYEMEGQKQSGQNKLENYVNGDIDFEDVLDDYASVYADNVNSNKPWSWGESVLGGENLSKKQRSLIKQRALDNGLIPDVKVKKVEGMKFGFADFESAGVVKETTMLPEELWKASDSQQFKWLNEQLGYDTTGYTWHHTEIPGKMQLIPTGIHNIIPHNGGRSSGMWAWVEGLR